MRRSTLKTCNRAGQAFRLVAQAISRRHNSLRARLGPQSAIVATAHKRACIVYHLLIHRTPFRNLSAAAYEQPARERDIAALRKKALSLSLTLVDLPR